MPVRPHVKFFQPGLLLLILALDIYAASCFTCQTRVRATTRADDFYHMLHLRSCLGTARTKAEILLSSRRISKITCRRFGHCFSRRTMSSSDASYDDDDEQQYSLEHLLTRLQAFLDQHSGKVQLAVALAGGGSHFLSTLASTPGASAVLLEGTVAYDRESFKDYVQRNQPHLPAADAAADGQETSGSRDMMSNANGASTVQEVISSKDFLYASHDASQLLGSAALHRALYLTARSVDSLSSTASAASASSSSSYSVVTRMQRTVGVAMTSKLRSSRTGTSRAFAIVTRHDGLPVTVEATLSKCDESIEDDGDDRATSSLKHTPRSRLQEDVLVSHILLTCLEEALSENTAAFPIDVKTPFVTTRTTTRGDSLVLTSLPKTSSEKAVIDAINRILVNHEPCVMLIPDASNNSSTNRWRSLATPVIPPNSLIVSGSFNPPHQGHVGLAQAALDATNCPTVWFELALTNADKQNQWTAEKVLQRLDGFSMLPDLNDNRFPWGMILTDKVPLFADKAYLLDPLQAKRGQGDHSQLHFVIGTDTLVRMVDPKYYGNSRETMLDTLSRLPCRFVIGGRLKQGNVSSNEPPQFISGHEEVEALPVDLQQKFVLLPEFRMDISSTELRKERAATLPTD